MCVTQIYSATDLSGAKIMKTDLLWNETCFFFDRSYFEEELSEKEDDEVLERVDNLIKRFGWNEVFNVWLKYLHEKCKTPESVINFAHIFWWLGGQDHIIPHPHKFLAYFYYRINFNIEKYDTSCILDSLATEILPKMGFSEADLFLHTDYVPERDPKIIREVENLKKENT